MIAKIIKGTSFSGVITYMLGKREGMAPYIPPANAISQE